LWGTKKQTGFSMATPITSALLQQSIAAKALTTLNLMSIFPLIATTDYENGSFERGEQVTIRIARTKLAQDFDPRSGGFTYTEGTYASDTVTLERLWTEGFPIYSHDAPAAVAKYIVETGEQVAKGIAVPNDAYMYGKYRTVAATSGAVQYFANAPVQVVANVDATGTFLAFDNAVVRNAGTVFDNSNVPASDRYIVMSSVAKNSFLGDAVRVTGFAAATQGSGQLITDGLANNTFVPVYGFNAGACNTVNGQTAVGDMDTASSIQSELLVASVAQDTTKFFNSAVSATTPLGAIDLTLTASTALNVGVGGVAVGQIAQIRTTGNVPKAHMVILRIASAGTTAPVITGVPYTPAGILLTAADFVAGDKLRIPAIGSVNVASHKEGLLLSSREIALPQANSGAVGATQVDPVTKIAISVIKGAYDNKTLSQIVSYHALLGAKFSDHRKGCLMLTA
jgi:hypothetical protein